MAANLILESMKKADKFIGDILEPFEKLTGFKFNNFVKPEDPKYVEPQKKKNLKLKLKKAQRKQKKASKDPEQAGWKSAIDKAKGVKNKDDPKLIKKTIQRKAAEKKRHKKKWAERVTKQKDAQELRQKKRSQNIKNRAQGQKEVVMLKC